MNPTSSTRQHGASRRATVKDVALAAGVSASTVSNVLHDHPNVTPDKRERVLAAIAAVDYRPSSAGRQLRGGPTNTIALAIPDLRSPYFADLAHAVIVAARRRGLTVFVDETDGAADREQQVADGYPDRGIDGIVFVPVSITMAALKRGRHDVPTVLLGEWLVGGPFDRVAMDSLASARCVTEHLLGLGRRRIAFAGLDPSVRSGPHALRLQGVRHTLQAHGLDIPDDLVLGTGAGGREEGREIARLLATRTDRVDAVVCPTDLLAVGVLSGLRERGVTVPDEVAVAAWDDSEEGSYAEPPLTSVAHDLGGLAEHALDFVFERRAGFDGAPRHFVVDHHLVTRGSTVARTPVA